MSLNLPYYYGHSGEQCAFSRIPKLLLTDERFAELSTDAKLLYGLLLDRMELSYRNGWIDEQNRVFIIFTADEVMSTLRCHLEKAARLFAELDSAKEHWPDRAQTARSWTARHHLCKKLFRCIRFPI